MEDVPIDVFVGVLNILHKVNLNDETHYIGEC